MVLVKIILPIIFLHLDVFLALLIHSPFLLPASLLLAHLRELAFHLELKLSLRLWLQVLVRSKAPVSRSWAAEDETEAVRRKQHFASGIGTNPLAPNGYSVVRRLVEQVGPAEVPELREANHPSGLQQVLTAG